MMKIPLCAVSLLILLGACSADLGAPAREDRAADESEDGRSARVGQTTACSQEATASVEGKTKRVKLELRPCRVARGQAPSAVLTNVARGSLGYGPGFQLHRKTAAGWKWINRRQAFPLPLFYLHAGERSDPEQVAVYFSKPQPVELEPGLYRVTKGVQLTPGKPQPPTMTVRATFRVTD
jgi:hypothetical protein